MNNQQINRRRFVRSAAAGSAAISWAGIRRKTSASAIDQPALLGGQPIHSGNWPRWPQWRESWESDILEILRVVVGIAGTPPARSKSLRANTRGCWVRSDALPRRVEPPH